jgi:hypothetical protein
LLSAVCFYFLIGSILLSFSSSPLEKEKTSKGGGSAGEMKDQSSSKQQKPKPTKAERRALQEAQRAAKAAAKGVY